MKLIIAILLSLFVANTASAQNIGYRYEEFIIMESPSDEMLYFQGRIGTDATLALAAHLQTTHYRKLAISSPGGDAREGLSMGKMLSLLDIEVVVPYKAICISACAYAILGVKKLSVEGLVAIHHPTTKAVSGDMTIAKISKNGALLALEMVEFVRSVGVSQQVIFDIYRDTDQDTFLVFTDTISLDKYLKDDNMAQSKKIMTGDELVAFQKERLNHVYGSTNRGTNQSPN